MKFDPIHDGELLSAYLDNALNLEQKEEAERLLEHSAEARAFYESLSETQALFGDWEPALPDAFFMRRVEARIATQNAIPNLATRRGGALHKFAVAALFLLTVGGMVFVSHLRQPAQGYTDIESFLRDGLDQDMEQIVASTDAEVSRDMVLDLVLTDNVR